MCIRSDIIYYLHYLQPNLISSLLQRYARKAVKMVECVSFQRNASAVLAGVELRVRQVRILHFWPRFKIRQNVIIPKLFGALTYSYPIIFLYFSIIMCKQY